jgi:hypothetical protein
VAEDPACQGDEDVDARFEGEMDDDAELLADRRDVGDGAQGGAAG